VDLDSCVASFLFVVDGVPFAVDLGGYCTVWLRAVVLVKEASKLFDSFLYIGLFGDLIAEVIIPV